MPFGPARRAMMAGALSTPLRSRAGGIVLAAVLVGCSGTESPSPSTTMPPTGESQAPAAGDGTACSPLSLRTPGGDPVDLNGEWGGGTWFSIPPSTGERTFILQIGECVWISITDDQFRDDPTPNRSLLGQMFGRISSDFRVTGDLVTIFRWVDPFTYGEQPRLAPVRLVIDFEDGSGRMLLREDREPGVQGPRCPNPVMWCPDPTELVKLTDLSEPSPEPSS